MFGGSTVLHNTTGAYDPNANSLVEESVGMSLAPSKCACVSVVAAAEHANEVCKHSKRPMPGQSDVVEPIVLERRAFSGKAECDL